MNVDQLSGTETPDLIATRHGELSELPARAGLLVKCKCVMGVGPWNGRGPVLRLSAANDRGQDKRAVWSVENYRLSILLCNRSTAGPHMGTLYF